MTKTIENKILASIMAIVLAVGLMPMPAFAAQPSLGAATVTPQSTINLSSITSDDIFVYMLQKKFEYTGQIIVPEVKVYVYGKPLVYGQDYTLSYETWDSNEESYVNVDTCIEQDSYTISSINGINAYSGSFKTYLYFDIYPADEPVNLEWAHVEFTDGRGYENSLYAETGQDIEPQFTVSVEDVQLTRDVDYTVSYLKCDALDGSIDQTIPNGATLTEATSTREPGRYFLKLTSIANSNCINTYEPYYGYNDDTERDEWSEGTSFYVRENNDLALADISVSGSDVLKVEQERSSSFEMAINNLSNPQVSFSLSINGKPVPPTAYDIEFYDSYETRDGTSLDKEFPRNKRGYVNAIFTARSDSGFIGETSANCFVHSNTSFFIAQVHTTKSAFERTGENILPSFYVTINGKTADPSTYSVYSVHSAETNEPFPKQGPIEPGEYIVTYVGYDVPYQDSSDGYTTDYFDVPLKIVPPAVVVDKVKIDIPEPANHVYNGDFQSGIGESDDYFIDGVNDAPDAGSYELTLHLKDPSTTEWEDGSTEPKQLFWEIIPVEVTVIPNSATKKQGDPDPALTASVTGTIDNQPIAYSLTREPGESAGTYAVTATGDADQGNYHVSFGKATLTIESVESATPPAATDTTDTSPSNPKVTTGKAKVKPVITVKKTSKTVKASSIAKKAASFKIKAKSTGSKKLAYKVTSKDKRISFKGGKVTIKKGTAAGTYSIKVKITSPANKKFKKVTKVVTLSFKVS